LLEILDVALLRLRFQSRCGLGLNRNSPFVDDRLSVEKLMVKLRIKIGNYRQKKRLCERWIGGVDVTYLPGTG
jgi:hypothetical protein